MPFQTIRIGLKSYTSDYCDNQPSVKTVVSGQLVHFRHRVVEMFIKRPLGSFLITKVYKNESFALSDITPMILDFS